MFQRSTSCSQREIICFMRLTAQTLSCTADIFQNQIIEELRLLIRRTNRSVDPCQDFTTFLSTLCSSRSRFARCVAKNKSTAVCSGELSSRHGIFSFDSGLLDGKTYGRPCTLWPLERLDSRSPNTLKTPSFNSFKGLW